MLRRLTCRAYEVTQRRYVRSVHADARGIHGQPKVLGDLEIDAGIVEFGKAEPGDGQNTIHPRRCDGPRRTPPLPRALSQNEELLPIVLVPHGSQPSSSPRNSAALTRDWMHATRSGSPVF